MEVVCPKCKSESAYLDEVISKDHINYQCDKCLTKFTVHPVTQSKLKRSLLHLAFIPPYYEDDVPMGGHYEVNAYINGLSGILHLKFRTRSVNDMNAPYEYMLNNVTNSYNRTRIEDLYIYSVNPLIQNAPTIQINNQQYYSAALKADIMDSKAFWCLERDNYTNSSISSKELFENLVEYYQKIFVNIDVNKELNMNGFQFVQAR
ncbi:hypothetical protein [Bacillus sp. Marseille-P3661]|uniref:hypothetical protein n=1 Tax=Bacillus sp. Marseille-P3661 TaxID=1936234 RepID=UPI000C83CFAA|nr:hypothetical protein [Bacillus sp. Marseille-P3661]